MNYELRDFLNGVKVRVVNGDEAIIETPLSTNPKQHLLGTRSETLVMSLKQSVGIGCELCQIVLSAAERLVANKVDDKEVLDFINKELCARLGSYKTACTDYVNLEGEEILQLLRKAIGPALICEMMGLCLKVQLNDNTFDLQVRNALNCTLCKMVFTEVKKKISEHAEQEKIIDYINTNLCEKVGKTKEVCKQLMEAYGPLFLEIVAKDVNPAQLCEMIGMCTKSDVVDPPVVEDVIPVKPVETNKETCVMCEFVIKVIYF